MFKVLRVYSDGGARGNPGPAAAAFLVLNENGEVIKAASNYIGIHTNNQTEYEALIAALEYAVNSKSQEVICHLDSELVTKQLRGEYKVKNPDLKKLFTKAQALIRQFKKVEFINVPRTNIQIQKADALVNKTLDQQAT
jgi:ribonuclease HI